MSLSPQSMPHHHNRLPHGRQVSPVECLAWLGAGWRMFLRNPGVWVAMSIIFIVLLFVLGIVPLLGWAVVLIGFPVLSAGMVIGCATLDRGEPLKVEHLFAGLQQHAGNLAMVGVFYMLGGLFAGFISLAVGGSAALTGYLLGALSGIGLASSLLIGYMVFSVLWVLLITALWFAPALVVLRDVAPLDAMKLSVNACFRNIATFVLLGILIYVMIWLAMLPAGLGILVLIPVMAGTLYASYHDVFPESAPEVAALPREVS
ncbi:MAG: hypothetical protein HGA47_02515 [Zoogloea sp.]|nr:hypothetical protein [Zoogloea sp.]